MQLLKKIKNIFKKRPKGFIGSMLQGMFLGLFVLVVGGYFLYRVSYLGKIVPGVYVLGEDMSGMTIEEATYVLDLKLEDYLLENPNLTLVFNDSKWIEPLTDLGLSLNKKSVEEEIMQMGRTGTMMNQLSAQWQLFYKGKSLPIPILIDESQLFDFVATASAEISNPAVPTRIYKGKWYNPDTKSLIQLEKGTPGDEVRISETVDDIWLKLQWLENPEYKLMIYEVDENINDDQINKTLEKAKLLLDKSLEINYIDPDTQIEQKWILSDEDLISFLSIEEEFDLEKITGYVNLISKAINRPAQNATFQFNEVTNKADAFKPAKNGLVVQVDTVVLLIKEEMNKILNGKDHNEVAIVANESEPEITNSDVNSLGIETLIGHGESTYYHSSAARQHNVEFAASKMNGVLVPPGEEFSFNKYLGEVSVATGFKQALVIKEGQTLLDDGGGVCQDSTTMFRAMLDAGLPITSWRNHSFRVGYYEQNSKPGFDATVFQPLPDLRFINDTPAYILIQTKYENMKLEYDLYGSDDGRMSEISNYSQWDASPPPPDLYKDDPTLPVGQVKKVESAVPGLKTKFDYVVTRDGERVFEKTFYSVYQPWQAVYMVGTKPN